MGALRTAWLLAAFVLLAGCSFEARTEFRPDASGTFSWGFGISPEEQDALGEGLEGAAPNACDSFNLEESLPEGASVHQERRDGELWCIASYPFRDPADLRRFYQEELDALAVRELEIRQDELHYDVSLDLRGAAGEPPDLSGAPAYGLTWQLILPGEIRGHNADARDGQTLTWRLSPGEARELSAVSALPLGPTAVSALSPGWILLAGVLLALAAGAVLMLRSRRG